MCIDPNAEPVAFALDTKLCHLLPTLTEPHREAIAQDLARTAIFMATAMAADMAQEAVNGLVPIPKMPSLSKPPAPALVPQAQTPRALFEELRALRGLQMRAEQLRVAINEDFAEWNQPLVAGDTEVFLPPVAGG